MDPETEARIVDTLAAEPVDGFLKYGTAGFRAEATRLRGAMMRVGVLAALRSASCGTGATGVMVTASHNPSSDNGAKIVDLSGSMLEPAWEARATAFVNDPNPSEALSELLADLFPSNAKCDKAVVIIGADTRPSSEMLKHMVSKGIRAVSNTIDSVINLGVVTTPQLQFVVRAKYRGEPCTVRDYYARLVSAYRTMIPHNALLPSICVDCANGVGARAMAGLVELLPRLTLINREGDGELNQSCGADFVQKRRLMPTLHGERADIDVKKLAVGDDGTIWASLDGDADRLVMYTSCSMQSEKVTDEVNGRKENDTGIVLADGDRFASLLAWFISKHLSIVHIADVQVGIAQTAYSNGSATAFVQALDHVHVVTTSTGVKHLERAICSFDIGIYWEPNGHGTVMFSDSLIQRLTEIRENSDVSSVQHKSSESLLCVSQLANPAVGDGIADLLLVLAILQCEHMTFSDWIDQYTESCSHNLAVQVTDKDVIVTEDFDRAVSKPIALRKAIENVTGADGRRAFVRPSGTEDVVRIYAEAPSGHEAEARDMAIAIARAVYDTCGGSGDRI